MTRRLILSIPYVKTLFLYRPHHTPKAFYSDAEVENLLLPVPNQEAP